MKARALKFALIAAASASVVALADGETPTLSQEAFLALPTEGDQAPFVVDVRSPDEYAAGHVPGAVNIPHDQVAGRLAEVPRDRDVVLYCRSGRRTELAAQVLAASGYKRLHHLQGDITGWQEQQRPMEVPRDPAACAAALKAGTASPAACEPAG